MRFLQDLLDKIEKNPTSSRDKPIKDVMIKDCDVITISKPFAVEKKEAVEFQGSY